MVVKFYKETPKTLGMNNKLAYETILEQKVAIESRHPGLKLETRNKTPNSIFIFYQGNAIVQIYNGTGVIKNPVVNTEQFQDSREEIEDIIEQLQAYYR